jgi:hypothetical protein
MSKTKLICFAGAVAIALAIVTLTWVNALLEGVPRALGN